MEGSFAGGGVEVLNGLPMSVLNRPGMQVSNPNQLQEIYNDKIPMFFVPMNDDCVMMQSLNNVNQSQMGYVPTNTDFTGEPTDMDFTDEPNNMGFTDEQTNFKFDNEPIDMEFTGNMGSDVQIPILEKLRQTNSEEILLNLDVQSKLIEGFMEVCISYRCRGCSYMTIDKKDFELHCLRHLLKESLVTETPENTTYVYLCSNCSEPFSSAEETKQHMVTKHNLKSDKFHCDEVPDLTKTRIINVSIEADKESKVKKEAVTKKKKAKSYIKYSIDLNVNIDGFPRKCIKKNCKVKCNTEKELKIHEKCHLDLIGDISRKLFKCFECNEVFTEWYTCCNHLHKAHEIDCSLLKCPFCKNYKTPLPIRMANHIKIHSNVRDFICEFCGKMFKQASQMRNHIIIHADDKKPNWYKSKQCNICLKMYSDSKCLKKHKEEVHSKLRPFVCSICGYASARRAMLRTHERQHTGQKPHECSLCSFKTADHNSLRKHIMRHTGVRPYKCPHCEYSAIQSGSYKNHMKVVHPNKEGIYICTACQYKTISEDNYIHHISDHLTGLIQDETTEDGKLLNSENRVDKQGVEESEAAAMDEGKGTFKHNTIQQEEESSNGSTSSCDDVDDRGGITIPAEPTSESDTKT